MEETIALESIQRILPNIVAKIIMYKGVTLQPPRNNNISKFLNQCEVVSFLVS